MKQEFKFPYDYTPVEQMDLWEMFLDTLEENEISYTQDQLDLIHKHITALEEELETA